MSNTLLTPTVIAKEALMQLENQCVMANKVHRAYKNEFVKIGSSVTVPKPVQFESNDGADVSSAIQDVTEQSTTFTISFRKNVAWQFSSQELTNNIKDYSEKYITPAAIKLASDVDSALCNLYKDVYFAAGTAGTTPADFAAMGAAGTKLDNNAVPAEYRSLVLDPAASWTIADAFKNFFSQDVAKRAQKGTLGRIAEFDIMKDQNIAYHTKGVATGTPLVNGASQTGASLVTDGWTNSVTGILKTGDIFTIAGVYHVNPISKASTGVLQQFVVTDDANSGASTGPATLAISPSIVTSGAYQTVSGSPADDAAITVVASHRANLAFHKHAFGLVMVPLVLPDSASFKARVTHNNLSIRLLKGYDIKTDVEIIRLDIMFGVKCLDPRLACRLLG